MGNTKCTKLAGGIEIGTKVAVGFLTSFMYACPCLKTDNLAVHRGRYVLNFVA